MNISSGVQRISFTNEPLTYIQTLLKKEPIKPIAQVRENIPRDNYYTENSNKPLKKVEQSVDSNKGLILDFFV